MEKNNIIKGIECHFSHAEDQCVGCPYYDHDGTVSECENQIADDLTTAIKETMPRIMTLEEAKECDFAYVEVKDKYDPEPLKAMLRIVSDKGNTMFGWFFRRGIPVQPYFMDELYLKTWRCWTMKPSEGKRKLTRWVVPPKWATVYENEKEKAAQE